MHIMYSAYRKSHSHSRLHSKTHGEKKKKLEIMKTLTDFTAESGCTCRVRARRQKKKKKKCSARQYSPRSSFSCDDVFGWKKKKPRRSRSALSKQCSGFFMCKHVHGLLHVHGSKGPRADYAYVCMHVHARRISSDIGVRRAVYVCAWLYV